MKQVILAVVLLLASVSASASVTVWSVAGSIFVQINGAPPVAAPMGTETSVFFDKATCDAARKTMLSQLNIKRSVSKANGTMPDYSTWLPVENVIITDFTTCIPSVQY